MVDQFREYLQYKPFHVKTDNNPLTYIMTSPNLDATGHHWVTVLVGFNMMLEYIKGSDNKVADCLSQVTERLDTDSVRELIQHTKARCTLTRADMDDPQLAQEDARIDNKIIVQAQALMSRKAVLHNVANKHWVSAQAMDLVIRLVREWMARPRENKISLSEHLNGKVADTDCLAFVRCQKDLRMSHGLLYVETHAPGTNENIFAFVVPAKKRQAAIDGCHRDAGHQGRDRMLSLMKERFWWPGMVVQVVGVVKGYLRCKQFEVPPAIANLVMIE